MLFSRWTIFQVIVIILLGVLAFIADMYKDGVENPLSPSMETSLSMIMTFMFIVTVIGLLSLLMYFQSKKSDTFLKHPLWDKMHILMPIIFVISIVLIIFSVFLIDSFNNIVLNNRWVLYSMIYYVLFLINLMILAFIHKVKKNTITNENKIMFSFIGTSLVLFVILFMM